jgi:hypothetical protein
VGLCVDESVPIVSALPRFSIPVSFDAGLGLGVGLCVELVLPMPSAVGLPPTPCVDGAAVSAARDKPLEPIQRTKAAAAISILRRITLSLNDLAKFPLGKERAAVGAVRRGGQNSARGEVVGPDSGEAADKYWPCPGAIDMKSPAGMRSAGLSKPDGSEVSRVGVEGRPVHPDNFDHAPLVPGATR